MKGFIEFLREQGVVGFAIAFILGGAVLKLVDSLVQDIISPIIALALGNLDNLSNAYFQIASAKIMWGNFVNVLIDTIIIALIIYLIFITFDLKNLDKSK
ncbi:MAG: hypothetical protein A2Y25_11625 [Candidatus Melainabacteria bacterium GWF2_37_15]|nr:MAG: hypothetical protein A2Y25_11625 [Candidatus Melainabacteria bacterium GWF2_37_15]